MNTKKTKPTTAIKEVYEQIIAIFFFGKPSEELTTLFHQDFMGYGTAAHEFLSSFNDLIKLTETQSEQLKTHPLSITRKPIYEKFLVNNTSYLIVEELNMHDEQNDYRFTARLSVILENISGQWLVTHFHASTPDANIDSEEAFPLEGLRKKNLELEDKIKERTRELEIEVALERVRARTMAMQHSDELQETSFILDQQVRALGIKTWGCAFNIYGEKESTEWFGNEAGVLPTYTVPREGIFKDYYDKGQKGASLVIQEFSGIACTNHYEYMSSLPVIGDVLKELKKTNKGFPTYQIDHVVYFRYGYLLFITKEPVPEAHDIFKRFTKVFEQTYTRFLDLQKAEAQAREAQIEAALERVRSRSMAMHNSDELKEVIQVLYDQFVHLNINIEHAGFILDYKENDDMHICLADHNAVFPEITFPYFDCAHWNSFLEAKKKGQHFFTNQLDFAEKNKFYKDLFQFIPDLPEEVQEHYFTCPALAISTVLLDNVGLYIENYESIPFSDEENDILMRFGKVFQQTYTRFLDLQKAEAQAREAKIETALEKVRSRTIGMQKGDELQEVAVLLYKELIALGVTNFVTCGYVEIHEDIKRQYTWVTAPGGDTLGLFYLPLTGDATFDARYAAWQRQQPIFHQTVKSEERSKHLEFAITTFNSKEAEEMVRHQFPDPTVFYCFNFSHGYLHIVGGSLLEKEEENLLARFTKVFEQTYTRFLDLQKAEAQAREAQIETALEKVRSRTMGMQNSDELPEVANNLFLQVQALGIPAWSAGYCIWENEDKNSSWCNMSSEGEIQKGFSLPTIGEGYNFSNPIKHGEMFHVAELGGKKLVKHYDFMKKLPIVGEILVEFDKKGIELPTFQIFHIVYFSHGYLMFITYEPVPNDWEIFKRFAQVFDLTYTRFLDLQKAEAQAKEAKIEVALEKVRSRTMSMQKSDELGDVANVLFQEMNNLVHNLWTCGFVLCEKDRQEDEWWLSLEDGFSRGFFLPNVNDYAHSHLYEGWLKKDDFRTVQLEGDDLQAHYDWLMEVPVAKSIFDEMEAAGMQRPEWQKLHAAYFSKGYLVIITREPCPEEAIFKRFAQVFDLTYTRFLDLQKAEAQAKEAKIEASLEKVRTVALSLKKSDDMLDIAQVLYEQLLELGFTDIRNAIIDIHNDENKTFLDYDYSHDMSSAVTEFSFYGDPVIEQQIKKVQSSNDAFFEIELKGKELEELIETRLRNGEKDDPRLHKTDHLTYNLYSFGNGAIGISNFGILSNDQKEILKRFRNVFTFAYKRYNDLANAEAQAMEAKIEASLEKVRSVALGLNKSDDMLEVAQALYEQLLALGFYNIRNSIIDIDNGDGLTFLDYDYSHEMGGTVTQMSYKDDPTLKEQLEDIIETTDGFSELVLEGKQLHDLIEMRRNNGEADDPRLLNTDSVSYILYAFGKGAIGISNFGVLPEHQKSILSRFRNVFTFAYQRYTDLAQSEAQAKALLAEKLQLENILTDLKATQAQLIQQEKLASLGQLTAGIAHEIKNPLNFVNNFSELSNELIDEVFEELKKLDDSAVKAEIKVILNDVKGNLIKVYEHGTRADSIVKSMLQHSRGGSGKLESTDLNALIKEYVNLAFHGMRAKKNPINVDIDLQLDSNIKTVSMISEDFSRVILNLTNNAFDAMRETINQRPAKLTVRTKQEPNAIHIEVEDNGPGIPDAIKDKIMQPFFTTKKGTEGTGLGLSITNDIIKAHGGKLEVTSTVGEGTKFIITLER